MLELHRQCWHSCSVRGFVFALPLAAQRLRTQPPSVFTERFRCADTLSLLARNASVARKYCSSQFSASGIHDSEIPVSALDEHPRGLGRQHHYCWRLPVAWPSFWSIVKGQVTTNSVAVRLPWMCTWRSHRGEARQTEAAAMHNFQLSRADTKGQVITDNEDLLLTEDALAESTAWLSDFRGCGRGAPIVEKPARPRRQQCTTSSCHGLTRRAR